MSSSLVSAVASVIVLSGYDGRMPVYKDVPNAIQSRRNLLV